MLYSLCGLLTFVLWLQIVQPFGETVLQVFARMSALRDQLDGATSQIDQGLVNTDPRFIAVPTGYVNLIPTDIRGLTLNRTPQQVCTYNMSRICDA